MTKRVRQTETSGMVKPAGVADYIVERLAAEGINHCFGVAGDYVFPMCDAVDNSAKVKWIGCANELNASYAADGYARIRGAAMLVTTYGVGELSALNGVMRAKAERSLVFHVVGMPSCQHQRVRKITHHTLGDGTDRRRKTDAQEHLSYLRSWVAGQKLGNLSHLRTARA